MSNKKIREREREEERIIHKKTKTGGVEKERITPPPKNK